MTGVQTCALPIFGPRGWGEITGIDRPFVRTLGAQPWSVVDALYRRATAFCLASRYEGFGLPALEAMARGTATVATTGSATEEFVQGAGVLFAPGDTDACAEAMLRLATDADERARIGSAGRERAEAMTWGRSARAHLPVYARVATTGARTRS